MEVFDFITTIEKNYKVNNLKFKDYNIWPLFRNILAFRYTSTTLKKETVDINKKNTYFGFKRLFKKVDFLFILDDKNRRKFNNYSYDRIAEGFRSNLQTKNYNIFTNLNTELPKEYRNKIIDQEEVISLKYIKIIFFFIKKFLKIKSLYGSSILKEICHQNNINLNYQQSYEKFIINFYTYRLLLKFMKVKFLITTCYHANLYQVAAAKSLNITVIEMQHGTITNKYIPYTFLDNTDNIFKPDYLLTFGEATNKEIKSSFIKDENIISVGSWLLEQYSKKQDEPLFIKKDREKYQFIICISAQDSYIEELKTFIEDCAKEHINIMFYYVPRTISQQFKQKNIKVIKNEDIYKIIKFSDFHLTMYSTCCIESIALQTPNILYNYKNISKQFYKSFLPEGKNNFYIKTVDEFSKCVKNLANTKSPFSHTLFKRNHQKNIQNFIKELTQ